MIKAAKNFIVNIELPNGREIVKEVSLAKLPELIRNNTILSVRSVNREVIDFH